jgi:hypothetical protein
MADAAVLKTAGGKPSSGFNSRARYERVNGRKPRFQLFDPYRDATGLKRRSKVVGERSVDGSRWGATEVFHNHVACQRAQRILEDRNAICGKAAGASIGSAGRSKRRSDRGEIMRGSWGPALPVEPIASSL